MDGAQFLVQWDEHPSHLATRLGYLLEHQSLVDVTLMCNTHTLKVHRAVLAACSPYFERQLGNHPLIVLKDMKFSVLKSLVEFMYCGETSVSEENLTPLLEAAKFFEVKGLSSMTKDTVCSPSSNPGIKPYNGTSTPTTSGYGRGSGRGRGRGRGRPPLNPSTKVGSPTESAQILLSLSGNTPSPQLYTTSKNVKIDPAVVAGNPGDGKPKGGFEPRRRGRKRGALNTAFRDRIMRDVDTQLAIENLKRDLSDDGDSPLLSSLLNKQDPASKQEECSTTKYMQQLKDIGLPTNVPILLDNGEGKLLTLTEDVLKTVVDSDGNLQLQVTESNLNKVKKPSRPFIVKEMRAIKSDDEEDAVMRNGVEVKTENSDEPQINEEMIESLKNGAVNEAELEPDAVVLYEVTENKKIEKYVVSAKEVSLLKSLTEQLVKQKKEALDASKNNLSTIDIAGTNTKVAELKLNLGKTRSVLSQVVGLKDKLKHLSKSVISNDANEKQPLSQMVQLEFIDGNGEKIEGYQVHGTLVEKRNSSGDTKEIINKDGDLMGLFDMVCGEGSNEQNNPLLGENSLKKMSDKRDEEMLSGDNCDTKEMSYQLVNLDDQNENISYDQIEAMMNDTSGNIVIEEKSHQYIIDNDGSLMNQDENYVVYESENVIYHNTESVLPDMSEGENSSNFVVGDTRVIQNEDGTEYIVYNDKGDLSEEIKGINERGEYIVYETDKSGYDDDSLVDVKENNGGFVIYSEDKKDLSDGSGISGAHILEGVSDGLDNGGELEEVKGSPTKDVPFAVGLVPLKDALEKFQSIAEHQPRKTRSNSINGETVGVRRRSSASSDTSDHIDKKRKLDPPLPPSDEASL